MDEDNANDLTFDYSPEELGLDEEAAVKIREIKQIRPLVDGQPWGIFWIDFEPKRLPVVAMRRILGALVRKKRGGQAHRAVWDLQDLMFISATGEGSQRGISFAHFRETAGEQPQLRTFSWDAHENHFYYLEKLNLEALRWPPNPKDGEGWRKQWSGAFTTAHREVIKNAAELAGTMAQIASGIRALINDVYGYESEKGPLHKLYESFKRVLIHDLTIEDFADMYAQTITYGLFSAFATPHDGRPALERAGELIPATNPFLRELFQQVLKTGAKGQQHLDPDELGVGELVELLTSVDMDAILRDFGRQSREHKEDPVIHFYESFLREYDPQKKAKRGVFYTPDPVVQFIVRSVDHLLRTEFDCADGLADTGTMTVKGQTIPKVRVLDPATGTGTFLKYVIETIHDTFEQKRKHLSKEQREKEWNRYVPDQLLARLYGFELMMAPYAIAHMKLGLALRETGYQFKTGARLRVYLTNSLQPAHEIPRVDTPFLAREAEEANAVKSETPITVVIGNPPYAGHSANASKNPDGSLNFIGTLLKDYYQVDGRPLGERNPKWLQDDYVKFIRFGQHLIEKTGAGILAMITNHGYLDNPTFRGMRQQLMKTFSEIYVLDLHGNVIKKEKTPDGSKDENVFDIQQGVAICIFVRHMSFEKAVTVRHSEYWGTRAGKYQELVASNLDIIEWAQVEPGPPLYLFTPQDKSLTIEYNQGWKVTDFMPVTSVGIVTARDNLTIQNNPEHVLEVVRDFVSLPVEKARTKYELGDDVRDWKVSLAQQDIRVHGFRRHNIVPVLYRPFDTKYTYYTGRSRGFICMPRLEVMSHMLAGANLGLVSARSNKSANPDHFYCTRTMSEAKAGESTTQSCLFPLYVYRKRDNSQHELFVTNSAQRNGDRLPNLTSEFVVELENRLGMRFYPDGVGDLESTFGPEDVFGYMYAIFHSPSYRLRYARLLKTDYPRLPITNNPNLFGKLTKKGAALVGLHLMESPALDKPITRFVGKGSDEVASGYPKYENDKVSINPEQGFAGVPSEVWEFHIGGYQVCHKWLKDRRGRVLTADDKAHYAKVVVALKETIRLMEEIDEVIEEHGGWPLAGSVSE
ncbi:MAG: N-6 DNA methylase [Chloroflexi bacterium]|nr:N-6 DNA methylase [Chloroflexota bacterium]